MDSKERERTIRLLREAIVEIDAGLTMCPKAGITNAIEYLERQQKENPDIRGVANAPTFSKCVEVMGSCEVTLSRLVQSIAYQEARFRGRERLKAIVNKQTYAPAIRNETDAINEILGYVYMVAFMAALRPDTLHIVSIKELEEFWSIYLEDLR